MNQKSLNLLVIVGLVTSMLALPGAAFAQTELQVDVATAVDCDQASFQITVAGGSDVHDATIEFGDSEGDFEADVSEYPLEFNHAYPGSGEYAWSVNATDSADPELMGSADGTVSIGPSVTLTSEPFPPYSHFPRAAPRSHSRPKSKVVNRRIPSPGILRGMGAATTPARRRPATAKRASIRPR